MFLLLKLHAYDEGGTHFFVLENDEECPEMETIFWPPVLQVMGIRERPWKFLLLRNPSKPIDRWLTEWPRIQVLEPDLADIMDISAENYLLSTPMFDVDENAISEWKRCVRSCGRDLQKASLALRYVLASNTDPSVAEYVAVLPQVEELLGKDTSTIMERILERVPTKVQILLSDLIGIILFAKRPLNRAELRDISRVLHRIRYASFDDLSFIDDTFHFLDSWLPGVFDFTFDEVRLQHPDARTFFLGINSGEPKIDKSAAEGTIAHICIEYFRDHAFTNISETMFSRRKSSAQPDISSPRNNLADYAVRYWHQHMRKTLERFPSENSEALRFLQGENYLALKNWRKALYAVSNSVIEDQEIGFYPLAYIACTDLQSILKTWIANEPALPPQPQLEGALTTAIKASNLAVARVLIPIVNLKDPANAESVLHAASSLGNEEFSISLIRTVLEVCPEFKWHPCLICRAAWLGQEKLV